MNETRRAGNCNYGIDCDRAWSGVVMEWGDEPMTVTWVVMEWGEAPDCDLGWGAYGVGWLWSEEPVTDLEWL